MKRRAITQAIETVTTTETTATTAPTVTTETAVTTEPTTAPPARIVHTEAELDQAVADVKRLKRDMATSYWHLGIAIANIIDRQLWKLARVVDDRGIERPQWKSFTAFCKSELQMTPKNAYELAKMKYYQREEDVQLFGRTNATLILQAPPKARPALEAKAAAGISTRKLAREVNEARAAENYAAPPTSTRTAKATTASTAAKKLKEPKLTIARLLGSQLVRLHVAPLRLKNDDFDDIAKFARAREDILKCGGAIGELDITDAVVERFFVGTDKRGRLVMKITRARKKRHA